MAGLDDPRRTPRQVRYRLTAGAATRLCSGPGRFLRSKTRPLRLDRATNRFGFVSSDLLNIPAFGRGRFHPCGSVTRPAIGFDRHAQNEANSGRTLMPHWTYAEEKFGFDRAPSFLGRPARLTRPLSMPRPPCGTQATGALNHPPSCQRASSAQLGSYLLWTTFVGPAGPCAFFLAPAIVTTRPGPLRPPPSRRRAWCAEAQYLSSPLLLRTEHTGPFRYTTSAPVLVPNDNRSDDFELAIEKLLVVPDPDCGPAAGLEIGGGESWAPGRARISTD